jgi:hypothetical protein
MKRSGYIPRRTPLRAKGTSDTAVLKKRIQALLREIVMLRDGGCVLRNIRCGHVLGTPGIVFQAEHLIERSNSATYADSRLVVCICKNCHGWKHFKKSNHDQYDALVKTVISPERVALWDRCEKDSWRPHRTSAMDWKLVEAALEQELRNFTFD